MKGKPSFCPKCGNSGIELQSFETNEGEQGYDVLCKLCFWSGDILPDKEP